MKTLTLTLTRRKRRTGLLAVFRALLARLEAMSDHELRDIGLRRGDIRDALVHGRD